jgi:hypothetical protein
MSIGGFKMFDGFKEIEKRLAGLVGADPNVCDLPRVMRLPGFPHQKQPDQLFMVEIAASQSFEAYSAVYFQNALAAAEKTNSVATGTNRLRSSTTDLVNGLPNPPPNMKQGYPDGQRTEQLTHRIGWCLGPWNMSEDDTMTAVLAWNGCNFPPLDEQKVRDTVASIARGDARKREPKEQPAAGVPSGVAGVEQPHATFRRLASLEPFAYDVVRVKEAERLGIRVGTLDDQVEKLREREESSAGTGRPLELAPPDPWPTPILGAELLNEIATAVHRYVVLPSEAIVAVTLWVMHAHAFEASTISPRLAITSPEMQCGKTTLLSVLEALVPKPLKADNVTAAAVFRVVERVRPTLLIDEADSFLKENEELRGVLNSGHRCNGQVVRLVGEDHEPRAFSTFCPTAIAAIGRLPSTLEDRSVTISMRRALPGEGVIRFDEKQRDTLLPLASKARRWADDHIVALRIADPLIPGELHGRAADNWRPLLTLAEVVGAPWLEPARAAAVMLSVRKSADHESVRVQLLSDIRDLFVQRRAERLSSSDITMELSMLEGRPWHDWGKGKPMTPNQLARQLAPFGVKPKTIRIGKEQPAKGYDRSDFDDAFTRYLPSQVSSTEPLQPLRH